MIKKILITILLTSSFLYANTWTNLEDVYDLKYKIKTADKPIMLMFTADWCGYCTDMKNETFTNNNVKILMQKFQLLRVDTTNTSKGKEAIKERLAVNGTPHIVFFNSQHKLLKDLTISGYMDAEDFEQRLQKVLEK